MECSIFRYRLPLNRPSIPLELTESREAAMREGNGMGSEIFQRRGTEGGQGHLPASQQSMHY